VADEKSPKPGMIKKVTDFVSDHWGEMFAAAHIASGFMNGKSSENAPDSAKAALDALTSSFGGKGDPRDEINFKRLARRLTKQQRKFLLDWIGYEFPLDSEDPWIRGKAEEALEEFRVLICAMVTPAKTGERHKKKVTKPVRGAKSKTLSISTEEEKETYEISSADDSEAFEYLQSLAKDIASTFKAEAKLLGKKTADLTDDEKNACELIAFSTITEAMQRQGSPRVPKADEKSLARQVRNIFNGIGPKSSSATKVAWGKAKDLGKWSKKNFDRAARAARANDYLVTRKQRARKVNQQTGLCARLFERLVRSM
jgi:hypothetical protein